MGILPCGGGASRMTRQAGLGRALEITVLLTKGRDNPLWIRVATSDGHLAWSSPIYVID